MSTMKPRTETVTLLQGDDAARADELLTDLQRAVASGRMPRINEESRHLAAARAYDEFMDEAVERAVVLEVQQLRPRGKYRKLMADHPPRPGFELDGAYGFNADTFGEALIPEALTTEFASIEARDELLDSLSDGNWQKLMSASVRVNQGGPDPKARLSERLGQTSTETSGLPDRLG